MEVINVQSAFTKISLKLPSGVIKIYFNTSIHRPLEMPQNIVRLQKLLTPSKEIKSSALAIHLRQSLDFHLLVTESSKDLKRYLI
jgi:hypothetical protein